MFVGICDDNPQDRNELVQLIEKQDCPVPVQTRSFSAIYELEQSQQKPDVLFLDIEIGEENSIAYFQKSSVLSLIPIIVLVSSHAYYVTSAFTVPVFQFLLKPIQPELFTKVFADCWKRYMQFQQYCEISSSKNEKEILPLRHIVFIKSESRQLIYTDMFENRHIGTEGLQLTLQRLQPFGFCQIHKSYLVNLQFVTEITEKGVTVQLGNKEVRLPVGKKFLDATRQQYLNYLAVKGAN